MVKVCGITRRDDAEAAVAAGASAIGFVFYPKSPRYVTPDAAKELKVDTGYGTVNVIQKTAPAGLKEPEGAELNGVNVVTLTAKWLRGGTAQSESIEFYVYRMGQ